MMYAHVCSNNEIDKRINVSKTANNIGTMGDNSTAAVRCLVARLANVITCVNSLVTKYFGEAVLSPVTYSARGQLSPLPLLSYATVKPCLSCMQPGGAVTSRE